MQLCLLVAYDGSRFHGFAENPDVRTVAGVLRVALERVTGSELTLTCAGRTDKGVHAHGQVVSFPASPDIEPDDLARRVTRLTGPEVVIREARWVDDDFSARFSAISRTYRYTVVDRPVPDPFLVGRAWQLDAGLDLRAMNLACDPLIGERDFSSFCRASRPSPGAEPRSRVRRVHTAQWRRRPELGEGVLEFEIMASSFCHQMVRSMVGTLVDVGRRRRKAGDMMEILRSRDRHAAGAIAPPDGLCLWEVGYRPESTAIA